MSSEYNNYKQPQKLIWHQPKFPQNMQAATGVIDDFQYFDHNFLKWGLEMSYYRNVFTALRRKLIGQDEYFHGFKKPGVQINLENWKKMEMIWYYGVDILVQKDNSRTKNIAYAPIYKPLKKKPQYNQVLEHLPALKKMNPVGRLADPTLGLIIRALIPLRDAWAGHDIGTMVTAGHWSYQYSDGHKPMFTKPEDVSLSDAWTYYVSRDYFSAAIDILEYEFELAESEVYMDNHELIESETIGFIESKTEFLGKGIGLAQKMATPVV